MSENIKVGIKIRPIIPREVEAKCEEHWIVEGETNVIQVDPSTSSPKSAPHVYDHVFGKESSNTDVFEMLVRPIVDAAVNGFNGTIFAYGQTASGKTYTMLGDQDEPGIIPLTVNQIFEAIERSQGREFLMRVSYMEIYNEKVNDLLSQETNLKVSEDATGAFVKGLKECMTNSPQMVFDYMKKGDQLRKIGETNMNERSSRSHSIFRIILESREANGDCDEAVQVSQINLVDLAGSERAGATGAVGERFKEGCAINKSLFVLGQVISKLADPEVVHSHVNFRDSKLTRILQPSLGGNALTAIVCTITPYTLDETLSTLGFATRARNIKNKAHVNEVVSEAAMLKRYARQIRVLTDELNKAREFRGSNEIESKLQLELNEKQEQNLRLTERINRLNDYMLVSGQANSNSVASDQKSKKLRRQTWSAPLKDRRFSMAPLRFNALAAIKEEETKSNTSTSSDFEFNTPIEEFELNLIEEEREKLAELEGAFRDSNDEISFSGNDFEAPSMCFIQTRRKPKSREREVMSKTITSTPPNVLRDRTNDLEKELDELQEFTRIERQVFNEALQDQIDHLSSERDLLQQDLKKAREKCADLEHSNSAYLEELNCIKSSNRSAYDLELLLMDANKRCATLCDENAQLSLQLKEANENNALLTNVQDMYSALQTENADLKKQLEKLKHLEQIKEDFDIMMEMTTAKFTRRENDLIKQLDVARAEVDEMKKVIPTSDSPQKPFIYDVDDAAITLSTKIDSAVQTENDTPKAASKQFSDKNVGTEQLVVPKFFDTLYDVGQCKLSKSSLMNRKSDSDLLFGQNECSQSHLIKCDCSTTCICESDMVQNMNGINTELLQTIEENEVIDDDKLEGDLLAEVRYFKEKLRLCYKIVSNQEEELGNLRLQLDKKREEAKELYSNLNAFTTEIYCELDRQKKEILPFASDNEKLLLTLWEQKISNTHFFSDLRSIIKDERDNAFNTSNLRDRSQDTCHEEPDSQTPIQSVIKRTFAADESHSKGEVRGKELEGEILRLNGELACVKNQLQLERDEKLAVTIALEELRKDMNQKIKEREVFENDVLIKRTELERLNEKLFNDSNKEPCESCTDLKDQLNKELENSKNLDTDLTAKSEFIADLTKQLNNALAELKHLQTYVKTIETELNETVKSLKEELHEKLTFISELTEKLNSAEFEKKQLQADVKSTEDELILKRDEKSMLTDTVTCLKEEVNQITSTKISLENGIATKCLEIKSLTEKCLQKSVIKACEFCADCKLQLEKQGEHCQNLDVELTEKLQVISELTDKINSALEENSKLEADFKKVKCELSVKRKEASLLQEELNQLISAKEQPCESCIDLKETLNKNVERCQDLDGKLAEKLKDISDLNEKVRGTLEENSRVEAELMQVKSELAIERTERSILTDTVKSLKEELNQLISAEEQPCESCLDLKETLNKNMERCQDLDGKLAEKLKDISDLNEKVRCSLEENSRVDAELMQVKTELTVERKEKSILTDTVKTLKEELNQLICAKEQPCESCLDLKETLNKNMERCQDLDGKLAEKLKDISDLNEKVRSSLEENSRVDAELMQVKTELAIERKEKSILTDTVKSLKEELNQLIATKKQPCESCFDLKEKLGKQAEHCQNLFVELKEKSESISELTAKLKVSASHIIELESIARSAENHLLKDRSLLTGTIKKLQEDLNQNVVARDLLKNDLIKKCVELENVKKNVMNDSGKKLSNSISDHSNHFSIPIIEARKDWQKEVYDLECLLKIRTEKISELDDAILRKEHEISALKLKNNEQILEIQSLQQEVKDLNDECESCVSWGRDHETEKNQFFTELEQEMVESCRKKVDIVNNMAKFVSFVALACRHLSVVCNTCSDDVENQISIQEKSVKFSQLRANEAITSLSREDVCTYLHVKKELRAELDAEVEAVFNIQEEALEIWNHCVEQSTETVTEIKSLSENIKNLKNQIKEQKEKIDVLSAKSPLTARFISFSSRTSQNDAQTVNAVTSLKNDRNEVSLNDAFKEKNKELLTIISNCKAKIVNLEMQLQIKNLPAEKQIKQLKEDVEFHKKRINELQRNNKILTKGCREDALRECAMCFVRMRNSTEAGCQTEQVLTNKAKGFDGYSLTGAGSGIINDETVRVLRERCQHLEVQLNALKKVCRSRASEIANLQGELNKRGN